MQELVKNILGHPSKEAIAKDILTIKEAMVVEARRKKDYRKYKDINFDYDTIHCTIGVIKENNKIHFDFWCDNQEVHQLVIALSPLGPSKIPVHLP